MVVVGLIIGNDGRALAMSDTTRHYVDMFWGLVDEILNAVLFVLLGMEVLLVMFSANELIAAGAAIVVTLFARLSSVGLPMRLLERPFKLPEGSWKVLTWGGLRGGISVALALSLPAGGERDIVVALRIASWSSQSSCRESRSDRSFANRCASADDAVMEAPSSGCLMPAMEQGVEAGMLRLDELRGHGCTDSTQ
jgi:hypothetical protein